MAEDHDRDRSAKTGRFVSDEHADKHPSTTVSEPVMKHKERPSVGRDVHYVSHGSADGAYPSTCRAAKITEVMPEGAIPGDAFTNTDPDTVCLAVFSPKGLLFDNQIRHDEDGKKPGTWHWPERV
jgi:hypothetical protein